jgi:ATP-dependent DNA helicase RecQ
MSAKKPRLDFDRFDAAINGSIKKFGHSFVKEEQKLAIVSFLQGNDVFLCLPTGFGKSLCYFCLPGVYDILDGRDSTSSIIIVVSPLSALMNDQVKTLKKKDVNAVAVIGDEHSSNDDLKQAVAEGQYQVIYTTPEVLLTNKSWSDVFQSDYICQKLVGLIIDEAHCVKKWYVIY